MSVRELKFTWEEYFWVAETSLPSWVGFQNRSGPYGSQVGNAPSVGSVKITFAPEGRGWEPTPLTAEELTLIDWFLANEPIVSQSLLTSLYAAYPTMRENFDGSWLEKRKLMPKIKSPEGLRKLIGLHSVNIHKITKNNIPYFGFGFGCKWDDEHGLGVLMHGTRLVEIGGEDTSILLWMAEKDARHP